MKGERERDGWREIEGEMEGDRKRERERENVSSALNIQ